MIVTSKIASGAYSKAAEVFSMMSLPIVLHILSQLERERDVASRRIVTSEFKYHTVLKYLRKLETIFLVRKERLGSEVTYRLNYDRLETVNSAAARLLA